MDGGRRICKLTFLIRYNNGQGIVKRLAKKVVGTETSVRTCPTCPGVNFIKLKRHYDIWCPYETSNSARKRFCQIHQIDVNVVNYTKMWIWMLKSNPAKFEFDEGSYDFYERTLSSISPFLDSKLLSK